MGSARGLCHGDLGGLSRAVGGEIRGQRVEELAARDLFQRVDQELATGGRTQENVLAGGDAAECPAGVRVLAAEVVHDAERGAAQLAVGVEGLEYGDPAPVDGREDGAVDADQAAGGEARYGLVELVLQVAIGGREAGGLLQVELGIEGADLGWVQGHRIADLADARVHADGLGLLRFVSHVGGRSVGWEGRPACGGQLDEIVKRVAIR